MSKRRRQLAAVFCAAGIMGIAAVVWMAGADGIVTVAVTLLVCEFVGAVARELRGEEEPVAPAGRLGALVSLLCAATLLDSATGQGMAFRIAAAALALALGAMPRRWISRAIGTLFGARRLPYRASTPIMGAKYHAPARIQPCMSSYRRGRRPGSFSAPRRSASMKVSMASR